MEANQNKQRHLPGTFTKGGTMGEQKSEETWQPTWKFCKFYYIICRF